MRLLAPALLRGAGPSVYALLARLYAAARRRLLQAIARAAAMRRRHAVRDGVEPARRCEQRDGRRGGAQEYTDLFIGVGKCEVNLHGSHWIAGFMMEKPLADLRGDLVRARAWRVGKRCVMLEDHLVGAVRDDAPADRRPGGAPPASLRRSSAFFERHVASLGLSLLHCNTRIALLPTTMRA